MNQAGNLIVLEGVDAAGKSTQIRMLSEYFTAHGHGIEYLHFPRTDAPYFGELIARFLRGEFGSVSEVDPYIVALLYAGDRKDASDLISSWLLSGKTVLLDRYTYSNIAYQCAKYDDAASQDRLMSWILDLEFGHFNIPRPDLNLFLDVPFSFTLKKLATQRTGDDRNYLNGIRDIHEENISFQGKVRDMYLRVSDSDSNLALINCIDEKEEILPPEKIFELIILKLQEKGFSE